MCVTDCYPRVYTNPASATGEGKRPFIRLITFYAFGGIRRKTDGKLLVALVA